MIRKVGERYYENNFAPTTKWDGDNVMIWGCFHEECFGPLSVIEGTVHQEEFINILASKFHAWFKETPDRQNKEFIVQNGASCHTGPYARLWKETHQIAGFTTGLLQVLT